MHEDIIYVEERRTIALDDPHTTLTSVNIESNSMLVEREDTDMMIYLTATRIDARRLDHHLWYS